MKTIFDTKTRDELFERLGKLSAQCERQWGKMTPSQMMEHTARVLEMATSDDQPVKQVLIGKAIGWIFKKQFLGLQALNFIIYPEYFGKTHVCLQFLFTVVIRTLKVGYSFPLFTFGSVQG